MSLASRLNEVHSSPEVLVVAAHLHDFLCVSLLGLLKLSQ